MFKALKNRTYATALLVMVLAAAGQARGVAAEAELRAAGDAQQAGSASPLRLEVGPAAEPGVKAGQLRQSGPIVVTEDGAVIENLEIVGPGREGDPASHTGTGIEVRGAENVTIRNVRVRGFRVALAATDAESLTVEDSDFSDNWTDPNYGWGDGERVGGLIFTGVEGATLRRVKAQRNWNGLDLLDTERVTAEDCDFSHCTNVGLKLERASNNRFVRNDISYGIRISPGEVHARDSTGVLLESGSDMNYFEANDFRFGGNGLFIRVLNGWPSVGNVFYRNDASGANNNGFESWSPGNVYIENIANESSYGFWLGGSDHTVLIGNVAMHNGRGDLGTPQNAPEPDFGHGGIVIVNGTGTHTLIEGNTVAENNGGGIVFRGDLGTRGGNWRFHHVVVQNNTVRNNKTGLFIRFADDITLAGNTLEGNDTPELIEDVNRLHRLPGRDAGNDAAKPSVSLTARGAGVDTLDLPGLDERSMHGHDRLSRQLVRGRTGQTVRFEAQGEDGREPGLRHRWTVLDEGWRAVARHEGERLEQTFDRPGFYRVSVTSDDGELASLSWMDVYVVEPGEWSATESRTQRVTAHGPHAGHAEVSRDGDNAISGRQSAVAEYEQGGATLRLALGATERLDPEGTLSFWMRVRAESPQGLPGGAPIVRLIEDSGGRGGGGRGNQQRTMTYLPMTPGGSQRNSVMGPAYPEGRETWIRVEVDLTGENGWSRFELAGGAAAPVVSDGLEFQSVQTPMATQSGSAMTSDGRHVYVATVEGDHVMRSTNGRDWSFIANPRQSLRLPGGWGSGMLAYAPGVGSRGSLVLRYESAQPDETGARPPRLVTYDIAQDRWQTHPTNTSMLLGATVLDGWVYGIARARMADFGGPITRVRLAGDAPVEERTMLGGVPGPNAAWFGWAARLAAHDGRVFAIKNDWTTPTPLQTDAGDDLASGDRLLSFDPAEFESARLKPDTYWDAHRGWEPAETPTTDHGAIPFEIGQGSALVPLPAGWSKHVGNEGGLLVIAGMSPSNNEGVGTPSDLFGVFDIASGRWHTGRLPGATGPGTSAAFHNGRVYIKRGGMNFVAANQELWIVSPTRRADTAGREAFDIRAVREIEIEIPLPGGRGGKVWIDGLNGG